ncbi:hypothetical protein PG990_015287 [Apiospora arundinis]
MCTLTKLMLEHQGDTAQLRTLLVQFRASKQKQLQSVEIALQLLDPLPRTSKEANGLGDGEVRRLLLTVAAKEDRHLSCGGSVKDEMRLEEGDQSATLKRNLALSWVWQSPKILAWSSWIFFLLGFTCDALVFFIIPHGMENKNTHQCYCQVDTFAGGDQIGGNEDVASSGSEGEDVWDLRLL